MQINRKVPDELADVRDTIKVLEHREKELRQALISGEADPVGDEFVATLAKRTAERLDMARLKQELGLEKLRPYLVPSEYTVVSVERMRGEEN